MLPRAQRLRAQEVRTVIATGKVARATLLSMKYSPTGERLRAAVVVSKKLAKTAPLRNRIRRVIYAALDEKISDHTGRMVLFVHKKPAGPITQATFTTDITTLCSKLS